jgi:hypothetical protein
MLPIKELLGHKKLPSQIIKVDFQKMRLKNLSKRLRNTKIKIKKLERE